MNSLAADAVSATTRILERAGLSPGRLLGGRRGARSGENRRDYFAVMMDLDHSRVTPWFVRRARKSVYMFDAWPSRHGEIVRFVESWGVQYAFVSSSQAVERLGRLSGRCTFIWVPEGVDPERYQQRSYLERDIDVLHLGRRYDAHHRLVVHDLEAAGRRYLFEKDKGSIVFPSREDFTAGLARSRISICFPSSLTHPSRAGDIETMTVRYLQSMASKCLVLGHAPGEMIDLFGYNPVIEADMAGASEQLLEILERFEDYVPLIEKNYSAVIAAHTWAHRWARIASLLFPAV